MRKIWNPETEPFRVAFYNIDNTPGNHGWSTRSYTFATLDQALLVAACPMDKWQTEVKVDVAKNRKTWNVYGGKYNDEHTPLTGYWEPIGKRNKASKGKPSVWSWAKGWSQTRAHEVAAWFDAKAARIAADCKHVVVG